MTPYKQDEAKTSGHDENQSILITAFDFPPQWGGVATYAWELASHLHNKGHRVTVVTKWRSEKVQAPFTIKEIRLPSSGLLSFPILALNLLWMFRKQKPDHVINTLWLPGGLACYLAKKWGTFSIKYSIIVHGMEIIESDKSIKKKVRARLAGLKSNTFKNAHRIFCVSRFSKNLLIHSCGISESDATVINNGVNPERFLIEKPKKSSKYPNLMTACRLVPHKGVDQVIMALPKLLEPFPDLHYNILGDGPDRNRLENLVKDMQLNNVVSFHGKVEHETLKEHYESSHLFVMLSRQEEHQVEGFGLVFLEASLSQTPSLGGRSGGIPDAILSDPQTGWLVDPQSPEDIDRELHSVLSDKDRLTDIGKNAQQQTLMHRTWSHQLEKMQEQLNG